MAGAMSLCIENGSKIILKLFGRNHERPQKLHRVILFRICRHLLNYCFTDRKVLRVWRKLKPKETAHVEGPRTGPPGRTKELSPDCRERDLSNREKSHILTRLKLMLLIS